MDVLGREPVLQPELLALACELRERGAVFSARIEDESRAGMAGSCVMTREAPDEFQLSGPVRKLHLRRDRLREYGEPGCCVYESAYVDFDVLDQIHEVAGRVGRLHLRDAAT
jgi:hypothetical protein